MCLTGPAANAATAARPVVHWLPGFTNGEYLTVYAQPAVTGSGVVTVTANLYGGSVGTFTDTYTSKRKAPKPPGQPMTCTVTGTELVVSPELSLAATGTATVQATVKAGTVTKCAACRAGVPSPPRPRMSPPVLRRGL